jgi:hypothetical protein
MRTLAGIAVRIGPQSPIRRLEQDQPFFISFCTAVHSALLLCSVMPCPLQAFWPLQEFAEFLHALWPLQALECSQATLAASPAKAVLTLAAENRPAAAVAKAIPVIFIVFISYLLENGFGAQSARDSGISGGSAVAGLDASSANAARRDATASRRFDAERPAMARLRGAQKKNPGLV